MEQQNQPTKSDKPLQGFLPWIILGIGILIMLVGIIVSSTLKNNSPAPRPGLGSAYTKSQSYCPLQRRWGRSLSERSAKSDSF